MAVGIVGGATKVQPTARANLGVLGVSNADELARIIASIGLAQNFVAMRALATTGIQMGHMALHAQTVALVVEAVGDEIDKLANELKALGKVRQDLAEEILARIRSKRFLIDGYSGRIGRGAWTSAVVMSEKEEKTRSRGVVLLALFQVFWLPQNVLLKENASAGKPNCRFCRQ